MTGIIWTDLFLTLEKHGVCRRYESDGDIRLERDTGGELAHVHVTPRNLHGEVPEAMLNLILRRLRFSRSEFDAM